MAKLTPAERDQIRAGITPEAMAANPLTCRALLALLDERDELESRVSGVAKANTPDAKWCEQCNTHHQQQKKIDDLMAYIKGCADMIDGDGLLAVKIARLIGCRAG